MSVRNTGVPYYLSQDVGTTVGTGAQTALASPGHSTNLYDIIVNGDASRRSSYVSNGSAYNTTPVSLSVFFGHSGPGSGTNQTPKSGPGYTKNNATYVPILTKLGTNTLNGGVLAGTNGDFESFFVGRDAAGNHYYAATFQSHAWRPGANLYRMRADGGQLQRVYSHHNLSDMVPVNSQSGGPMSNITSNVGSGWLFYSMRRDTDGRPRIMVTSWSAGNVYDGETVNSSITGNNNVPQTLLSGVDAWGQVSDAINIPNTDDRYTTGATLYIRSNQGPRIVFAKRNGSNGILNQHTRNMAAFNDPPFVYDNGVIDHNSGCVGGLCYSPGTSRIYTIFTYEQRNGSFTGGENLLINFTNVGGFNGTGTISTDPPRLGLIHFIWGEGGGCRPDWGTYTASHICYLDTISGTDRLAYAFTKIATSIRGYNPTVANGLWFRITNANPINNVYPAAESDQCGEYPTLYQQFVASDVNYYQKIRVRKMGVQRIHNASNTLIETWYWIALTWVDQSGQRIRARIWRANFTTNTFQQMHDFTAIDSFRGMGAFNGHHTTNAWEPQHLFVFGTNNTGLQNTETYASGKGYNPGVEHDRSKSIRFV